MGFKFKRLVKSAKKTIKSAGRAAAKVVKYAAPVVGTLVGGPVGGLIGTGLAAGASQVGPNKNRGAALKRSIVSGLGVTAGGSALGLISGAGFGASGISSISRILGGGAPEAQPEVAENELLGPDNFLYSTPASGTAAATKGGNPPALGDAFLNAASGGLGSFIGNQNGPSGLEGSGARAGGTFGTEGGGVASGGILGGIPEAQVEGAGGLGSKLLPLALVAAGVFVVMQLSKKKG